MRLVALATHEDRRLQYSVTTHPSRDQGASGKPHPMMNSFGSSGNAVASGVGGSAYDDVIDAIYMVVVRAVRKDQESFIKSFGVNVSATLKTVARMAETVKRTFYKGRGPRFERAQIVVAGLRGSLGY